MNRRQLLAGVGLSISIGASGCIGTLNTGVAEITNVEFETGVGVDKRPDDDPRVRFSDNAVYASGVYSTGDMCYDAHLEEPVYDVEDDKLHIELTRQHDGRDECEEVDEAVSYRVIVHFEEELPAIVRVAEEPPVGSEIVKERDTGLLP